jgi:hypothetical protein
MTDLIPFDQINRMAQALGRGKMFGKTAEDLLPLMLIAQAEGKHPAIATQEYDIIQGRPAINSRASLSRFQAAGGSIQWLDRSDAKVSAKFSHPKGGELTIEWTMKRAEQAGLTGKDNWKKYPTQMLSARVIAEGVRAVYPACLSGMYTTEEVQDFDLPPMRDVTPPPEPAAQPSAVDSELKARVTELADKLGKTPEWRKAMHKMHNGNLEEIHEALEKEYVGKLAVQADLALGQEG